MKRLIGAVLGALLCASAVQAATVELVSPATGEYVFKLQDYTIPAPAAGLPYNAWALGVYVNDQLDMTTQSLGVIEHGESLIQGASVNFFWFPTASKPTLNVVGQLYLLQGATFTVTEANQTGQVTVNWLQTTKATPFKITDVTYPSQIQNLSEPNANRAAVVPIGGTLPLLVTALGVFGWMARRQAKLA